jgi:hypothetical protein
MKIELTMTELLLIVDMIKNGTEQDNEGDDFYLMQEFLDGKALPLTAKNVDSNEDTDSRVDG